MDGVESVLMMMQDFMPDWESVRGVFCALAWFSTAVALLLTLVSLVAELGGGDVHGGDSSAEGGDAGIFSLRAIVGFFLGFGWGGFAVAQGGGSVWAALAAALAAGLVMFALVALCLRLIYGLKSEVVMDYAALVGTTGQVYVTLPPHGEPGGQVQVFAGQLLMLPAIQHGDTALPAQTSVRVLEASPAGLVVEAVR